MLIALALLLALSPTENIQVPPDPGLYYLTSQGPVRLEGRAVTVTRPRKKVPLPGPMAVGGGQARAEILGASAEREVSSSPVFYYRVPAGSESIGAGDLVLVKLRKRGKRREFTVSGQAEWSTSAGIPLRSQVRFNTRQVESGVFRLEPADDLAAGEYGFYLFRGRDLPGLLYDFSVGDGGE
jgi:hypothetical protein